MAKGRILAGIDIGTSKVVTLIGSQAETGRVHIIGVAAVPSKGLRKSQIVDIEEATESITESVEAAERMAGYSISQAFVSIGGAHIESQNSKGVVAVAEPEGEITATDVDRVIEAARAVSLPSAREILHVIPRDFMVDSQAGIKDPVGMTGVRLETEAHLITASSTAIKNLVKCVNEIGVDVAGVVFSGLAASETTLSDTERELGVILLDIGGGSTSLSVFIDGALSYSSVIPIGARNITNDLAIGMRVSLETSETIKLALSNPNPKAALPDKADADKDADQLDLSRLNLKEDVSSTSKKTLVEGIIKPRLNEIFTMVGLELKKSGLGGQTPAGVVLVGGGALTVGIEAACKRTLSLPTRIGVPQGLSGLVEEIGSPAFAASTGLILYAAKTSSNLNQTPALNRVGRLIDRLPVKGTVTKAIDFIKSFLP